MSAAARPSLPGRPPPLQRRSAVALAVVVATAALASAAADGADRPPLGLAAGGDDALLSTADAPAAAAPPPPRRRRASAAAAAGGTAVGGGGGALGLDEPPALPPQPPPAAGGDPPLSLAALAPCSAKSLVRREVPCRPATAEDDQISDDHISDNHISTNPTHLSSPVVDYGLIYENATCEEDWIAGSDRSQKSVADCASLCRANAKCKYFAFSEADQDCAQFWDGCTKDNRFKAYASYEMVNKSNITFSTAKNCSWSIESCKLVAVKLGLRIGEFSKEYGTKGCFTYAEGSYKGTVYYGTENGSSIKEKPAADLKFPLIRPAGYPYCNGSTVEPSEAVSYPIEPRPVDPNGIWCGKFGNQTYGTDLAMVGCSSDGLDWVELSSTVTGENCTKLCADEAAKVNPLCCYSGPLHHAMAGCWMKVGAFAIPEGHGDACTCKKGNGMDY